MAIYRESAARQKLITLLPAGIGAEIGVQEGRFSAEILDNWKGEKLYMVDAWRFFALNYHDTANCSDSLHAIKMMSALENTQKHAARRCLIGELSLEAAKIFPNEFFDWIYLDANHTNEAVTRDIAVWLPKLKPNGILCGDDYFEGERYGTLFGVKSAVDAIFKDVNLISEPNEVIQWWVKK